MLNIDALPDSFMKKIYFNTVRMEHLFDKLYLDCVRNIPSAPIILSLLFNMKQE